MYVFNNLELDPFFIHLFNKGLNFSLAPRKILIDDIICNIKFGIRDLLDNVKDVIRQGCAIVLRKSRPPKNNISKNDFLALTALRENLDFVILKVD